jgi:hypothetical protein
VFGFDTRDLHVNVYGISQRSLPDEMDGAGSKWVLPSSLYLHPPKDFTKGTKVRWRRGFKDLMWWITRG